MDCNCTLAGGQPSQFENQPEAQVLLIAKSPFKNKHAKSILKAALEELSVPYAITYLVLCPTPDERDPAKAEIEACSGYLQSLIAEIEPKMIVCLGDLALKTITGKKGIKKANGTIDFGFPIPVAACVDPSYVIHTGDIASFEQGISSVISYFEPDRVIEYSNVGKPSGTTIFNEFVSVDIETTGLRPHEEKYKSISFSQGSDGPTLFSQAPIEDFDSWLTTNQLIAHNAQFEHKWFMYNGVWANIVHDTRLIAYLIDENASTSLESLCLRYGIDTSYKKGDRVTEVEGEELAQYNCRDTHNTYELFKILWPQLSEPERKIYQEVLIPATRNLALIELAGLHVEPERIQECHDQLDQTIAELQLDEDPYIQQFEEAMGKKFNIKSTPQRKILIFDLLGYDVLRTTDSGAPSTQSKVLKKMLKQRHTDTLEKIISYSEYMGAKMNYLDVMKECLRQVGDQWFVFSSLWLGDTSTGRLKSNSPNIQNQPKSFVRRIVTSRFGSEGYLLEFDYDQIELRIIAGISDDTKLIEDFRAGKDPHLETAVDITGKKHKAITEKDRDAGKRINFMIPTGASAGLLAYETGLDHREAEMMLRRYWKAHPELKAYFDTLPEEGVVYSKTGMKRTALGERAKNQIKNFGIQNPALIAHLMAINKLVPAQLEMGNLVILPTHDSFLSDCRADFKETYHMKKEILESITFDWMPVPFTVSGKVGYDYGSMEKIGKDFNWEGL